MLGAVVEHFLDRVSEREFAAPHRLLKLGFHEVHYLHGQYEFGKDFIARATDDGREIQYVFQSKAGDLNLGDWSKVTPQLDLLRTNTLAHPGFDAALPRRAVLLLTGRLTGGAGLAAQNYCDQARDAGLGLQIWDREALVELQSRAPPSRMAGPPRCRVLKCTDTRRRLPHAGGASDRESLPPTGDGRDMNPHLNERLPCGTPSSLFS